MNSLQKIFAICALLSCMPVALPAQNYDAVARRNFWNGGVNAAGLRQDSVTVSVAGISGDYVHGGFRNSHEAAGQWSVGAEAKTITHFDKMSMIGAFSFGHSSGREMSGSMFTRPGFYPVDVLEFTPGRKDLQKYAFMGGVAVDVAPAWRLGGRMDFAAMNYAKRKDLRHSNFRLDMEVSPSVMFHKGRFAVGLSYIYGKNSESVKAEEIGSAAATYYAFLDKGLMYGSYESWQGSGVHLSEPGIDGFPVKEITHGASVQMQHGGFYADATWRYASGEAGERQTVWFRFPSHSVSSNLGLRLGKGPANHFLRIGFEWRRQENYENILGKETHGGVTVTHIYGSNLIFVRESFTLNPEYESTSPRGEFRIGFDGTALSRQTTQMFPYVASQKMLYGRVYASGELHMGRVDLLLAAAFSKGRFSEKDNTVETDVESGEPPHRMTQYYDVENEYLTAARIETGLGLRYNFWRGLYIEIAAKWVHGFKLVHISGADRFGESLKLGYNF